MKKHIIRVPGYFIKADIDFPDYHPHTIWWLAFISEFLKGNNLDQIQNNPPWPIPNQKIITNQILKELIENNWIVLDWENFQLKISQNIIKIYKNGGELALAQEFLKYTTERGQWWIDAISGTPLSMQKAIQYDYDFNRKTLNNTKILFPRYSERDLIENLNLDIKTLIKLFKIEDIDDPFKYNRAFLSSPFKLGSKKDIEFEMFGSLKGEHQRILPQDLAILEPMLWENAPEIFGKKPKRKKKLFLWTKSVVENFAIILEKFPHYISLLTSQNYFQFLIQRLKELILRKEEWINWYQNSIDIVPLVDVSELFFDALSEICTGNLKINEQSPQKSTSMVILYTSFLNPNHLYEEFGLINSLKSNTKDTKFLIIYGHASDDPPEQQNKDMQEYKNKIMQLAPKLKNRVEILSSMKRSHEKIVISTNCDWIISSWNPGSSNPDSQLFEVGVMGRSKSFTISLLKKIEENIEKPDDNEFFQNFKGFLNSYSEKSESREVIESYYDSLKKNTIRLIEFFQSCKKSDNIQDIYEKLLYSIRLCLLPFIKRGKVKLINEHQSRDVLITQIKSSQEEIFLASDRITKSALDRTLLNDIIGKSGESKKFLRILWGREWEQNKKISRKNKTQLRDARNTIKLAQSILGNQILSSFGPMENHAKFSLFDSSRGLITSENILSYGGEKGIYESRELGVFIECIPVIRHIQGGATFHRLNHLHPNKMLSEMAYRPYEWIVFGNDNYFAFEIIKDEIDFDYSKLEYIESAIEDYLKNPDPSDYDEFDRDLINKRYLCFLERKQMIQDSFIEYLWKEGIRYYLLKPNLNKKWIPYTKTVNKDEIGSFYSQLDIDLKVQESKIKDRLKEDQKDIDQRDTYQSDKIHPVIEEIMRDIVLVKAGFFMMGDNEIFDDRPVHKVEITEDFYISKYIVTQEIWEKVIGELSIIPPHQRSPKFPIIYINYYDAQRFLKKLNNLPGSGGFDLPTDAQWEYACRADSNAKYCFGNNQNLLNKYAWNQLNSNKKIHDIGLLKPNEWGLYDMHGLMYELVKDDIRKYNKKNIKDPIGPLNTKMNIARGGSWGKYPFPRNPKSQYFRCGRRSPNAKYEKSHRLSFRLVRKKGMKK